MIIKALQSISMLTKLYISNCIVTDDVADDIAAAISCNTQLQELDVSKNNPQSTGAIKVAVALQNISMLTKLYSTSVITISLTKQQMILRLISIIILKSLMLITMIFSQQVPLIKDC